MKMQDYQLILAYVRMKLILETFVKHNYCTVQAHPFDLVRE